jgi:hypothetical protein
MAPLHRLKVDNKNLCGLIKKRNSCRDFWDFRTQPLQALGKTGTGKDGMSLISCQHCRQLTSTLEKRITHFSARYIESRHFQWVEILGPDIPVSVRQVLHTRFLLSVKILRILASILRASSGCQPDLFRLVLLYCALNVMPTLPSSPIEILGKRGWTHVRYLNERRILVIMAIVATNGAHPFIGD